MQLRSNFEQLKSLIDTDVRHQFINVAGIRTSYLEAGQGPALVLLHGAGGGAASWYKVIAPLSRHFRVIAFDKPGYGESDKPWARYDKPFFTNWLKAAVDELDIDNFSLAGNSQGGSIGIHFALHYPEYLHRLILVDSGGLSDEWDRSIIYKMVLYRLFPTSFWGKMLGSNVMKDPTVADPAWHRYSMDVIRSKGGRYPFFLGRGKAVSTYTDEELRSVSIPTLVIWGEDEAFFPIAHGERAARLIPDARLEVIPQAGHIPHLEQPKLFCELIKGFVQA